MMQSGIYKILNLANGKAYIGSASYLRKRLNDHKCMLQKGKHPNSYLQSSWNKYGEDNFEFMVVQICEKKELLNYEQFWIDWLEPAYNLAKIAGNTAGVKWTENQRVKYLNKRIGIKRTQEEKDKISLGMIGKKNRLGTRHSNKTRILMSDSHKNKTQEQTDNQSAGQRKIDKWPCFEGARCKCEKCCNIRLNLARQYRLNIK